MYLTSDNKLKLEKYNSKVVLLEKYDNIHTKNWSNILTHKNGTEHAILKHPNHEPDDELKKIEVLLNWFNNDI